MKNLNLIPPAYKDRLRLRRVYMLLREMIMAVMLYTIFLGITLLIARLVLVNNFTRIVNETTLVTRENRAVEQQIANMNRQISAAQTIQKTAVPWAEFIVAFSKVVPEGVVINSMQMEADANKRSTINGLAKTREALLDFESKLRDTPFIEKVNLPFKNKLDKTDAYFTITLSVKFDKVPLF